MSEIIYRYINWDWKANQELLTHRKLYFFNAKTWEKDGEYDFEFGRIDSSEFEDMIHEILNTWACYDKKQYKMVLDYYKSELTRMDGFGNALFDIMLERNLAKLITQKKLQNPQQLKEDFKNIFFKRSGIVSFSKDNLAPQLWNWKLVNNKNVVCIGIDQDKLFQSLKENGNSTMGNINYSCTPPTYNLSLPPDGEIILHQLVQIAFSLKNNFINEHETRVFRLFRDDDPDALDRHVILEDNAIKEILVFKDCESSVIKKIDELKDYLDIGNIQFVEKTGNRFSLVRM